MSNLRRAEKDVIVVGTAQFGIYRGKWMRFDTFKNATWHLDVTDYAGNGAYCCVAFSNYGDPNDPNSDAPPPAGTTYNGTDFPYLYLTTNMTPAGRVAIGAAANYSIWMPNFAAKWVRMQVFNGDIGPSNTYNVNVWAYFNG